MVVVVDYQAGNLYNVGNALKHLGAPYLFSSDPETVRQAERVILPGVGSARTAMDSLREHDLVDTLRSLRRPFLGICLGLQLLFERSEEDDTRCLGLLPGSIRQFDRSKLKVPHIGWNQVCDVGLPLFADFPPGSTFYFVHSFYAEADAAYTRATTEYGVTFASMVARDNYWGVQFHPERSGELGLALLKGFLEARF